MSVNFVHVKQSPKGWKCGICLHNDPGNLVGHHFKTSKSSKKITDIFHRKCLQDSRKFTNSRCPLCRKKISSVSGESPLKKLFISAQTGLYGNGPERKVMGLSLLAINLAIMFWGYESGLSGANLAALGYGLNMLFGIIFFGARYAR